MPEPIAGKLVVQKTKQGNKLLITHQSRKGMSPPRQFNPKNLDPELAESFRRSMESLDGVDVHLELENGAPVRVRRIGAAAVSGSPSGHPAFPHPIEEYRGTLPGNPFVYPYNFSRIRPDGGAPRGAPASHDRFHADRYSGRIDIRIIPKSPWFIPEVKPYSGQKGATGAKGHCCHRFLRDREGKPVLPATALKGAIRTMVEALTDSCFAVFSWPAEPKPTEAEGYIGMRYNPRRGKYKDEAKSFLPGRVQKDASGRWVIRQCKAIWVTPPDSNASPTPEEGNPQNFSSRSSPPKAPGWKGPYGTKDPAGSSSGFLKPGWRIKPHNPVRHHYDRVFVTTSSTVQPTDADWQAYERLIKEQGNLADSDFARGVDFIKAKARAPIPAVGDLVYFRPYPAKLSAGSARKFEIARTAIPRVSARRAVIDLLPAGYHPCADPRNLCPACRMFGMVSQKGAGAYRGNIRIEPPRWVGPEGITGENLELKVLGAPHPESTNFYLIDDHHKNDDEVSFDYPNAILRGRKRYWVRRTVADRDWRMPRDHPYSGSNQSITAEVLRPECERPQPWFETSIRFENLQDWEIGALLFALELPWSGERGRHQIGRGKPLGLGQCEVDILSTSIILQDGRVRYATLAASRPPEGDLAARKNCFIAQYKEKITAWSGRPAEEFEQVPFIADLRLLTTPRDWHIRYPEFRAGGIAEMGDKTFAWFCGERIKIDRKTGQARNVGNVEKFPPESNLTRSRRDVPLPLPEETEKRTWHGDDGPIEIDDEF